MGEFFGRSGRNLPPINAVSLEQGAQQAKEVIKREEVSFEKFESIFGSENIRADKAYVENRKELFKKNQIDECGSNSATIFEAILHMRLKKGEWIDGVQAIKTNEFDDIANGIDEVLRVIDPETKEKRIAFAIDALTVGGGPLNVGIEKKMNRIHEDITSNKLPKIKYFLDEETKNVGIENLPRIVVAADVKTMEELNELWMEKSDRNKLVRHPLQLQILEQIIEQSNQFSMFAKRDGKDEIAEKYNSIRLWARKKLEEKRKINKDFWNDNARQVISNSLYMFKDTTQAAKKNKHWVASK